MPTPTGHCCFLIWTGPGDSYLVTSRPWWAVFEWLKGVELSRTRLERHQARSSGRARQSRPFESRRQFGR